MGPMLNQLSHIRQGPLLGVLTNVVLILTKKPYGTEIIILILQMRYWRLREFKQLVQYNIVVSDEAGILT